MNYGKYLVKAEKPNEKTHIFSDDSLQECWKWAKPFINRGWTVEFVKPTVMKRKPDGSWEESKDS